MKVCTQCNTKKSYAEFNKDSKNKDGYRTYCRQCGKQYDTMSRRVKQKYGISTEELNALIEQQKGLCKICEAEQPLIIDHDHSCCPGSKACGKCVRGLLCSNCNTAIGLMKEDLRRFAAATIYLIDWEKRA